MTRSIAITGNDPVPTEFQPEADPNVEAPLTQAQLQALAQEYVAAYEQHRAWEETKSAIAAKLVDAYCNGFLESKFPIAGYNFSISSRASYTYSTETRRLSAQLKAAQEFDKEEGIAIAVPGAPFITLNAIKEPKPKRGR